MAVFTVKEPDHEDGSPGREIVLTDVTFRPLGYSELCQAALHRPIHIPLSGYGEIQVGQRGEFRTTLESRFSSRFVGLVRGGWLPSALAFEDNIILLPDRCVVAQLNARLKNGQAKPQATPDFIGLLAATKVRINPLLFVLEGDDQQNPSSDSLERHLDEAVSKIKLAMPNASLVAADAQGLSGVLGLVNGMQSSMTRKQDFLARLNGSLKSPISRKDVPKRWNEVLAAARDCGIPVKSLVVLAALSAIVMPNGKSPGKGLLKFGER